VAVILYLITNIKRPSKSVENMKILIHVPYFLYIILEKVTFSVQKLVTGQPCNCLNFVEGGDVT
jgi:hypothetical protein